MKTRLTQAQLDKIDDLLHTIEETLQDEICVPDMDDVDKSNPVWDEIYMDRANVMYMEAYNYLKNNL